MLKVLGETGIKPDLVVGTSVGALVEFYGGLGAGSVARLPTTLILHGDADDLVPVERAHALDRLLRERDIAHATQRYPDAGHGFTGAALDDSVRRMVAVLDATLVR